MKVYFEASSVLVSYNLDLPRALLKANVIVDIEHPLLYAIYLYERFHGRYSKFKVIPPYINKLTRSLFLSKVDVVHLNSLNVTLAKRAKELEKPIIAVLHAAPFPKEVYNAINDHIDVYVAPSYFTKQNEEAKIGSKKVVVIHHGVNTELFNPSIPREKARREIGIPLNVKVVLWNARLSPEKRLEDLIIALSLIIRERDDVLVLVKTRAEVPSYKIRINRLIKRLSVERHILFDENWTPLIKMPIYYGVADLYVNTSVTEAFGSLAMLEAMACGIPTIANNSSSNPEALGDAGLLYNREPYDLAEKILEILSNDRLARILSYKSYKRIKENLTLTHIAKKYIDLYNRLMGYYSDE